MNKRIYSAIFLIALGLLLIPAGLVRSAPQADTGTAFTYQGRLHDSGSPANGSFNFIFRLYDDQAKSTLLGTVTLNGLTVSNGLFQTELDFGSNVFNGQLRWLEIEVNGISLSPLQKISPAPYALALPGLWTQQTGAVPNIIGGYHSNIVNGGVFGATISGGGPTNPGNPSSVVNRIYDNYGTVGGGGGNTAGSDDGNNNNGAFATIGGGDANTASSVTTTVGGGESNTASGPTSTVGGGYDNTASKDYTTISGGQGNEASEENAAVGGGEGNVASGGWSTIGGGFDNTASGYRSTVGGGSWNNADASFATIAGGGPTNTSDQNNTNNRVHDNYGTIGGGGGNIAGSDDSSANSNPYATVGGGQANKATGDYATVSGGQFNEATANFATIGGGGDTDGEFSGFANYATDSFTTVSGGGNNYAGNNNANTSDARSATVGGGEGNRAANKYTTVPGGRHGLASNYGQFAYASGQFNSDRSQAGDAQTSIYVLRNETTDGTQTELFLDGGNNSERINIADGQTVAYEFQIAARSSGNQSAGYQGSGVIENVSGTVISLGYAVTMEIEDNTSWSILISADNTNNALVIKVTGANSTNIRWVATVRTTEVTFPPP